MGPGSGVNEEGGGSEDNDTNDAELKLFTASRHSGTNILKEMSSPKTRLGGQGSMPLLIIDCGSGFLRVGFLGDSRPRKRIPNAILQMKKSASQGNKALLVGEAGYKYAFMGLGDCFVRRPFQKGLPFDFECLRMTLRHILVSRTQLNIPLASLSEMGVVFTEPYNVPPQIHITLLELLFDEFKFASVLISQAQLLLPYSFPPILPELDSKTATKTMIRTGRPAGGVAVEPEQNSETVSFPVWSRFFTSNQFMSHSKDTAEVLPFLPPGMTPHKRKDFEVRYQLLGDLIPTPLRSRNYEGAAPPLPPLGVSETPCKLVVDIGHGGAWALAMSRDGVPVESSALRNFAGGGFLNEYLGKVLAHRHLDMGGNEYLIQHIKESSGRISLNFSEELPELASARKRCTPDNPRPEQSEFLNKLFHYSLPGTSLASVGKDRQASSLASAKFENYFASKAPSSPVVAAPPNADPTLDDPARRQQLKSQQAQVISLGVEQIAVPELLFSPDDLLGDTIISDTKTGLTSFIAGALAPTGGTETTTSTTHHYQAGSAAKSHGAAGEYATGTSHVVATATASAGVPTHAVVTKKHVHQPCGVAEMIRESMARCPESMRMELAQNILVSGGSSNFPNLVERLYVDLRQTLPHEWPIRICRCPEEATWIGAAIWTGTQENFDCYAVKRSDMVKTASVAASRKKAKLSSAAV